MYAATFSIVFTYRIGLKEHVSQGYYQWLWKNSKIKLKIGRNQKMKNAGVVFLLQEYFDFFVAIETGCSLNLHDQKQLGLGNCYKSFNNILNFPLTIM